MRNKEGCLHRSIMASTRLCKISITHMYHSRVNGAGIGRRESWQTLHAGPSAAPTLCMALHGTAPAETVVLGDNGGLATVLSVITDGEGRAVVEGVTSWVPHDGRCASGALVSS